MLGIFMMYFYFFIIIISCFFWGFIGYLVGKDKGINGFWWGFALGLIGIIVVLCMDDRKNVPQQRVYIPNNIPNDNMNKYDKIEKLSKLHQIGAITDEEFEIEKKKILR